MSGHLSAKEVEKYRKRELLPADLLAFDLHLSQCADCRKQLPGSNLALAVMADMRMAASAARHLSYEQMTAYLDGNADEETCAAIEGHIESCARCAEQWRELKKFAAEMGATGQGVPSKAEKVPLRERIAELFRRPSYRLAMVGATAAVAVVVAVAIQTGRHSGGGAGQTQVATSGQPQQPGGTSSGELMSSNTQPGGKLDLPGGTLRDGDHDVTVVLGAVQGLDDLPQDLREAVTGVLGGKPVLSADARWVLETRQPSGGENPLGWYVITPVATAVENIQPTFRWHPLNSVINCVVHIYDEHHKEIQKSGPLASNEWTPARTLTSGHRYIWQVAGMRKGSQLGTTLEARFVVLDDDAQLNLDQARRQYAVRPLVLGTVYEQNGLLEEARKQFSQLASENPGSGLAQKPLQQAQALLQPSRSLSRIP